MVKLNRRTKFLILTIIFVFMGWFCLQPLVKLGTDQSYAVRQEIDHKLTAPEINAFLALWQQMQKGPLKEYLAQRSLHAKGSYPRPIVKWLAVNNWDAERFFYDEQRLQDLLKCADLKIMINANIETNKRTGINLEDIIKIQKEGLKACLFEQEEMDLIERNRKQIKAVFVQ